MPLYVRSPVDGVITVAMATAVVTVVVNPVIYIIISSSTVELVIVGMTGKMMALILYGSKFQKNSYEIL